MTKKLLYYLIVFCFVTSSSAFAEPDKPLLFSIKNSAGDSGCILAINHLVLERATETTELINCERNAKALVVETNINRPGGFSWDFYKRNVAEPSVETLTISKKKKIVLALFAAGYNQKDIEYFLKLHPSAIYRALQIGKGIKPNINLVYNIDIEILVNAGRKNFKILEIEPSNIFAASDKQFDLKKLDTIISQMCELYLNSEYRLKYIAAATKFAENSSAQPSVDTAWEKKKFFNTSVSGLISDSVVLDIDSRNNRFADEIVSSLKSEKNILVMVGAAHIGGPNGVLKLLSASGLVISRLQ